MWLIHGQRYEKIEKKKKNNNNNRFFFCHEQWCESSETIVLTVKSILD